MIVLKKFGTALILSATLVFSLFTEATSAATIGDYQVLSGNAKVEVSQMKQAENVDTRPEMSYDPDTKEWIGDIYLVTNGKPSKISFKEYKRLDNESKKISEQMKNKSVKTYFSKAEQFKDKVKENKFRQNMEATDDPETQAPAVWYAYNHLLTWDWYADEVDASAEVFCGNPAWCPITKTTTITQSESFSVGLSGTAQNQVRSATMSLGYEWSQSLSNGSSYTLPIKYNYLGRIKWRSHMRAYHGVLEEWRTDGWGNSWMQWSSPTTNSSPVKLGSGELDGMYYTTYGNWNLLYNSSFEEGNAWWQDWHPDGQQSAMKMDGDWPSAGNLKLTHWSSSDYRQTTYQTVEGLSPGVYRMAVRLRSSGGQKVLRMELSQHRWDGKIQYANLPTTPVGNYVTYYLDGIRIETGRATFGVYSDAYGGQWAAFDQVELVRTGQ